MTHLRQTLVLIGHGMVGHRFVQAAIERGLTERWDIIVFAQEPRAAYDRVALTSFFEVGAEQLSMLPRGRYDDPRVRLILGTAVTAVDGDARTVTAASGEVVAYDALVMATGSIPVVPPLPGRDLAGCFVYRVPKSLPRAADRLQRTSVWLESIEGDLDFVRSVVVDDSLGLAADLEADMAGHIGAYQDEWRATLEDEDKLVRFVSFINAPDTPDPSISFVTERGQIRPAILGDGPGNVSGNGPGNGPEPVLVASTSIPVGAPR